MTRMLALLRAVNVGGPKLPMAQLRDLGAVLGWTDVQTYIQSGNLLFSAAGEPAAQLRRRGRDIVGGGGPRHVSYSHLTQPTKAVGEC